MAIAQHRGTTAASMFQNGISRNTKCDNLVGFCKSSHKYGVQKPWVSQKTEMRAGLENKNEKYIF